MWRHDAPTPTKCPHCKGETETGTRGGCEKCGMVKHTANGRSNAFNTIQSAETRKRWSV